MGSPSGSEAPTPKLNAIVSEPRALSGAVTTGARSLRVTVRAVVVLAFPPAPSFTAQRMLYGLPAASPGEGVPLSVAAAGDGPGLDANARNAGAPVWVTVSTSDASASVAFAVNVMGSPARTEAEAGAVIMGAVFPTADPAPSASNQSPGSPPKAPHGSA